MSNSEGTAPGLQTWRQLHVPCHADCAAHLSGTVQWLKCGPGAIWDSHGYVIMCIMACLYRQMQHRHHERPMTGWIDSGRWAWGMSPTSRVGSRWLPGGGWARSLQRALATNFSTISNNHDVWRYHLMPLDGIRHQCCPLTKLKVPLLWCLWKWTHLRWLQGGLGRYFCQVPFPAFLSWTFPFSCIWSDTGLATLGTYWHFAFPPNPIGKRTESSWAFQGSPHCAIPAGVCCKHCGSEQGWLKTDPIRSTEASVHGHYCLQFV